MSGPVTFAGDCGGDVGPRSPSALPASGCRSRSLHRQKSLLRQTSSCSNAGRPLTDQEKYLRSGFKHLYVVTRIAGLVFYKPSHGQWSMQAVLSIVWYTLLLAFTWANVVRYGLGYSRDERFSPELMVRVVIHIVYIYTALTYTVALSISLRRSHLLTLWTSYYVKYGLNPRSPVTLLQKRSLAGLGLIFITWLLAVAIQLYEPYTDSPFGLLQVRPLQFQHLREVPWFLTFTMTLLNSVIHTAYWLYITWIVVIGLSFKDEYNSIVNDFIESEENDSLDLEAMRMRHLDLSSIVNEVDDIISAYTLLVFLCNVPCVCVSIYHLILWDLSLAYKSIICVCLIVCLTQLLSVICVSTWLNEKACAVKAELYRLSLSSDFPQIKMMQYLTFLNYVTEGQIGYTAWKIFYLRKHTLKMICLMIISYTVVLLKFGTALNPEYKSQLMCNRTTAPT